MSEGNHTIQTAGLIINAGAGEVFSQQHQRMIRLSPVNMRVLLVLLEQAEQTTSRQQLFDAVWPNQTVSDDALTRCISDLRSQLKPLTTVQPIIDTIPKIGYRWLSPVGKSQNPKPQASPVEQPSNINHKITMTLWIVIITVAFSWLLLSLIQWWSKPISVPLVILPTQTYEFIQSDDAIKPVTVNKLLKQATKPYKDLQYLSEYAIQSHQGSPFPYFSHQFGVRWFIESQLSKQQQGTVLTLNLVDAKTALVIYSEQTEVKTVDDIKSMSQQFINFIAEL